MNINIYILYIFIYIFIFILKLYFIIKNNNRAYDVFTYLLIPREIRKIKRIPQHLEFYVIDKYYKANFDYPPLLFLILALIPENILLRIYKYIPLIFDLLFFVVIIFITFKITNNFQISLLSGLIYQVMPFSNLELFNLNARMIANILFTISFVIFLLFVNNPNILYFLLFIIFGCLLCLTHKFELQSALIITLVLTVFHKNLIYLIYLPAIILFTLFISKGYYVNILKGHINFLRWMFFNYDALMNNKLYNVEILKKNTSKSNVSTYLKQIINFIFNIPFLIIVVINISYLKLNNFEFDIALWLISLMFSTFIITAFKKLHFIGEGKRYAYNALYPVIYLTAISIYFSEIYLLIFCIIVSIIIFIKNSLSKINNTSLNYLEKEILDVANHLKIKKEKNIFILPEYFKNIISYYADKTVMGCLSIEGLYKANDYLPTVKGNIDYVFKKYQINYIVIQNKYIKNTIPKIKNHLLIYQNNCFSIFKMKV